MEDIIGHFEEMISFHRQNDGRDEIPRVIKKRPCQEPEVVQTVAGKGLQHQGFEKGFNILPGNGPADEACIRQPSEKRNASFKIIFRIVDRRDDSLVSVHESFARHFWYKVKFHGVGVVAGGVADDSALALQAPV